jgi:membrane associated rhomboid family serine protease
MGPAVSDQESAMGIYDREYYRSDGPSFLGSLADSGKICKWLIAVNVLLFVIQTVTRQQPRVEWDDDGAPRFQAPEDPVTKALDLNTEEVVYHGQVWRLLTAAFLHGGFLHILFNMLFLWWFGHDLEDIYGSREFLAFYIAGALVSSLSYVGWQLVTGDRTQALGASGAVMAVMVLFAMHYPHHKILMFWVLPVSIWFFVLFKVLQDAYVFLSGQLTMVGVTAHLGGAAFGFIYYKREWRVLNALSWLPSFSSLRRQVRPRPRLRLYQEDVVDADVEPVPTTSAPASAVDEQLEAQLDAVLAKVARSGKESLTENERQILLRASEIYKRRRT